MITYARALSLLFFLLARRLWQLLLHSGGLSALSVSAVFHSDSVFVTGFVWCVYVRVVSYAFRIHCSASLSSDLGVLESCFVHWRPNSSACLFWRPTSPLVALSLRCFNLPCLPLFLSYRSFSSAFVIRLGQSWFRGMFCYSFSTVQIHGQLLIFRALFLFLKLLGFGGTLLITASLSVFDIGLVPSPRLSCCFTRSVQSVFGELVVHHTSRLALILFYDLPPLILLRFRFMFESAT